MAEKGTDLAVRAQGELTPFMMSTEQLLARKKSIQDLQSKVMVKDVDFGIIPGCNKPSLLKPGAETLNVTFGLRPILNPLADIVSNDLPGGHREFQVTIHILSAGSDKEIATGLGSCSTAETKYRFRKANQKCPSCGKEEIRKGSKQYGGGWYCNKKEKGCGAKFKDGDPAIENQEMGRIEHDNPADYFNTCLKMAKKRALVDGTLNATGASHVFTQDVEDMAKEIIRDAEFTPAPIKEPTEKKPEGSGLPPEAKQSQGGQAEGQEQPKITKQSTDIDKQNQILEWAQGLTGANAEDSKGAEIEALFVKWGNFIPVKDTQGKAIPEEKRKMVSGKKNIFDYTGKWLNGVFDKAEREYYAWKNKEAE